VRWWRRGELQRASAARPRLRGRRSPNSGKVQQDVGQLWAVEGPSSPRGCVGNAGCDGDGRRRRRSGGDAGGAGRRRCRREEGEALGFYRRDLSGDAAVTTEMPP
jgi:hypothetical protein